MGTGNGTQVLWKISTIFFILSTIFPALKQILEEAFKKIKVVLFVAYDGDSEMQLGHLIIVNILNTLECLTQT